MTSICYVYTALSFMLAKLYFNQVNAAPTEGYTTVFSKVTKSPEGGEKQSGSCSYNILPWPTPATDPHAKSSTSIFDTPQQFSEPQELHPLYVPRRGLLSTGDAYLCAENPLYAGFASLLHGEENGCAFGNHDHDPLRGENGYLASSSSIHRNDSPLPLIEPPFGEGGQVKSSSQRKRKSRTDIPSRSAHPGITDDSQFTEVPQNANVHSSPQMKRKFQIKIQQSSAQRGMTDQSQLTEVAQHPEGAVETRHELHGNKGDSGQERAPAAPGPLHTTKAQSKRERKSETNRREHDETMNEVYWILYFTDRTLELERYPIFSDEIMGRIEARLDGQLMSGEMGKRPRLTAKSFMKIVENITKISTYLILKDISMLKTGKEEIITDKEEIEEVLLFMDIFWKKISAGTLKLPGKFNWIPKLAVRMHPNPFCTSFNHRTGAYFWLATSKEIKDFWLGSFGNISP